MGERWWVGVNNGLSMSIIAQDRGLTWTLVSSPVSQRRNQEHPEEWSNNWKRQSINSHWHQHPWMAARVVTAVKMLFLWSHSSGGSVGHDNVLLAGYDTYRSVWILCSAPHLCTVLQKNFKKRIKCLVIKGNAKTETIFFFFSRQLSVFQSFKKSLN